MRLYATLVVIFLSLGISLCLADNPCADFENNKNDQFHPEATLLSYKSQDSSVFKAWRVTQVITTRGLNPFKYIYGFRIQRTEKILIAAGSADGKGPAPDQRWRVDVYFKATDGSLHRQYWISSNEECFINEDFLDLSLDPIDKVTFSLLKK
jgi:hypothetical protein